MVQSSKKRKSGGKFKGRGGKSFQTPRPKVNPNNDVSPYFSLRDEVSHTAKSGQIWTKESRLRTKAITFVSAGHLVGSIPEQEEDKVDGEEVVEEEADEEEADEEDDAFADDFRVDLGLEDEEEEEVIYDKQSTTVEEVVAESSNGIAKLSINDAESPPSTTFIVDTKPDTRFTPKLPPPKVRDTSPAPSDSSDEVVFRGRNAPRMVVDPVISTTSSQPMSQMQSRSQSSRKEDSSTDLSVTVTVGTTTVTEVKSSRPPAWDPMPVEWVHRSKPGIGWSRPQTMPSKHDLVDENMRLRQTAEDEAMADYMANIREHAIGSDHAGSSDLDAQSSSEVMAMLQAQEERMVPEERNNGFLIGSFNDAEDEGSDDDEDENEDSDDDDDSLDSDEDFQDEKDLVERKVARMSDEHIARLLAKQEDMGLGSDELLIFDDSDGDPGFGFDGLDDGSLALPQLPAAGSRGKKNKKKGKGQRDTFPSANLFADVLDQDPYNGFDIMDFDRPSLRPKKKGRKFVDDVPAGLDEELQDTLRSTWEKDREKKRLKKAEREELRSQGLLGRGKNGKADLFTKYNDGMSLDNFRDELRQFLSSTSDSLSLPPMDKHLRKGIHEIAMEFGLKSKSIGSGKTRYPKLLKTRNTIAFDDRLWTQIQSNINRGFFARLDRQGRGAAGRPGKSITRGGGAAMAGVKYRDGEVVGATAPEIGIENRGRAMLEKMGWSAGMALGTGGTGILQPIAHTVKISKAGLG